MLWQAHTLLYYGKWSMLTLAGIHATCCRFTGFVSVVTDIAAWLNKVTTPSPLGKYNDNRAPLLLPSTQVSMTLSSKIKLFVVARNYSTLIAQHAVIRYIISALLCMHNMRELLHTTTVMDRQQQHPTPIALFAKLAATDHQLLMHLNMQELAF